MQIPSLSRNLPPDATVQFRGRTYRAGETFDYDGHGRNPCAVLDFIREAVRQIQEHYPSREWSVASVDVDAWNRACTAQQELDEFREFLDTFDWPGNTGHDLDIESLDAPPGGQDETAETLGSPEPDTILEAGGDPRKPQELEHDPRTPAERLVDSESPQDAVRLAEEQRVGGASEEEVADAVERARQGRPPEGKPDPFRSAPVVETPVAVGEPVDLFTGQFYLRAVDLQIDGLGPPIRLVRTYRSGLPTFGPFGFNWDHNYNVYLRELNDGRVAVWTGLLSEELYTPRPDGGFEPPVGVHTLLERQVEDPGAWSLTFAGGMRWRFARGPEWPTPERIPLRRIEDSFGNAQRLLYDDLGRLATVVDALGRELHFRYGACDLLEEVRDFTGRSIRYEHAPYDEHLERVVRPATPDYPEGQTYAYRYDAANTHPALRHNLLEIRDPDDRVLVLNEYGRDPGTANFNRVVRQYHKDREYLYRYRVLSWVPPHPKAINTPHLRAEYLAPCAPLRVYTFNFRGDLLDERCRLVADGSHRLWQVGYAYGYSGQLIELRGPTGMRHLYEWDETAEDPRARGNLLSLRVVPPPTSALPPRLLWSFAWEPRFQRLRTARDESGGETRFVYDYEDNPGGGGGGAPVRIEHPVAIGIDGRPQEAVEHFEHDAVGRPLLHVSPAGVRTRYVYAEDGPGAGLLAETIVDPDGDPLHVRVENDELGRTTAILDAEGRTTRYVWDALDQLREMTAPRPEDEPLISRFVYGPGGLVRSVWTPRGSYDDPVLNGKPVRTDLVRDVNGAVVERIEAANTALARRWRFWRDAEGRPIRSEDPLGRVAEWEYDERGLLLRHEFAVGTQAAVSARYRYDRAGNRTAVRYPGGTNFDYEYDSWHRLRSVTRPGPAGERPRVFFDYAERDEVARVSVIGVPAPGKPVEELTAAEFERDERGRLRIHRQAGRETRLDYDADGRPVEEHGPEGAWIETQYNGRGDVVRIADGTGRSSHLDYDTAGRVVSVAESYPGPDGLPVTVQQDLVYGADGGLIRVEEGGGNVVLMQERDDRGLIIAIETADGVREEFGFDVFHRPVERRRIAGGQVNTERWLRDPLGRVTTYVDPQGAETRFAWTALDSIRSFLYPDGTEQRALYDVAGRLRSEISPTGSETEYHYDAGHRLEKITFQAGGTDLPRPDHRFTYDGLGRVLSATTGDLQVNRTYDRLSRLIREEVDGRVLLWEFDDHNGDRRFTWPDGRRDRFEHDRPGRLKRVVRETAGAVDAPGASLPPGAEVVVWDHIHPHRAARRTAANGTVLEIEHDPTGRPLAWRHHRPGDEGFEIAAAHHVYDAGGRLRLEAASPAAVPSTLVEYDGFGRLARRCSGVVVPATDGVGLLPEILDYVDPNTAQAEERYAYTAADDRATWEIAGPEGTTTFTPTFDSARRLTDLEVERPDGASSDETMTWDEAGNRLEDGARRYLWDCAGHLAEVRDRANNALLLRLQYDALGRPWSVEHRDGTVRRLLHDELRVVQVEAGDGSVLEQRVYGVELDELVAISGGGGTLWCHGDPRQSLIAITDDDGQIVQRYRYDGYGRPEVFSPEGKPAIEAPPIAPHFTGRPWVAEAALYDFRERFHDPRTGYFLERDPLGYRDSPSPWAFAAHDPVNRVDPLGLYVTAAWDALSLGVGVYSLRYNMKEGNHWAAALDGVGIALDGAALLLPIPGGAGMALKAWRGASKVRDSARIDRAFEAVQGSVRTAQAVRGGQFAIHGAQSALGVHRGAQHLGEGEYGAAAAHLALSTIGFRQSISGLSQLRPGHFRGPEKVYTVQDDATKILAGQAFPGGFWQRIWGQTEGAVYGMNDPLAAWWRASKRPGWLQQMSEPVIFRFEGEAARVFRRHEVSGLFSGMKNLLGQYKAGFGDLRIMTGMNSHQWSRAPGNDRGLVEVVVRRAELAAGEFPGRSAHWRRLRVLGRETVDQLSNSIVPMYSMLALETRGSGATAETTASAFAYDLTAGTARAQEQGDGK